MVTPAMGSSFSGPRSWAECADPASERKAFFAPRLSPKRVSVRGGANTFWQGRVSSRLFVDIRAEVGRDDRRTERQRAVRLAAGTHWERCPPPGRFRGRQEPGWAVCLNNAPPVPASGSDKPGRWPGSIFAETAKSFKRTGGQPSRCLPPAVGRPAPARAGHRP
jgi:hypothetical protein